MENSPQIPTQIHSRIVKTLWLFYGFFLIGFDNGILGPTLIDLKLATGVAMETMTNLFFVTGAGFIVGILLSWVTERYLNMTLFLAASLLSGSLVNVLLGFGSDFTFYVCFFFLQGCLKGFVDYAILTVCNNLWKDSKGVSFQFVTLGSGIASFLVPFIAEPFLASGHLVTLANQTDADNNLICRHDNNSSCYLYGDTRVQMSYFIVGMATLPPAAAFVYYFFVERGDPGIDYEEFGHSETRSAKKKACWLTGVYLLLLFLFHVPVFGICLAYGDLLTRYGVEGKLRLHTSKMAAMTSAFWGAFLAGRVVNLVLSRYVHLFVLLVVNFAGLLAASLLLVSVGEESEGLLWFGSAIFGLFSAAFLPAVMAWSDQFYEVDGGIITSCLVASGVGEILVPFVGGKLFDVEGGGSLMVLIVITVCYEIAAFFGLVIVGNLVKHKR